MLARNAHCGRSYKSSPVNDLVYSERLRGRWDRPFSARNVPLTCPLAAPAAAKMPMEMARVCRMSWFTAKTICAGVSRFRVTIRGRQGGLTIPPVLVLDSVAGGFDVPFTRGSNLFSGLGYLSFRASIQSSKARGGIK